MRTFSKLAQKGKVAGFLAGKPCVKSRICYSSTSMKVKISQLRELTNKTLGRYGYSEEEAKIISEVLLYAQLRGNNQGVVS